MRDVKNQKKSLWRKLFGSEQALVLSCPRCQHLTRFQRAPSDGAWVCQCCLRCRAEGAEIRWLAQQEPGRA